MYTRTLKRALTTGVASTVIASGLVLGASPAPAAEPEPPAPAGVLDDLLGGLGLESLLVQGPQLLGTGQIGSPLEVLEPVFQTLPLGLLIQNDVTWLCNGEVIPGTAGLSTLVPTEALAGCEIVAQTVSTLLGLVPLDVLTLVTSAVGIPAVGGGGEVPEATSPAKVTGDPAAGKVLTVVDPVWDSTVDATTYAWRRDGVNIPGATGKTYTVTPDDVAKQISVQVTGKKGSLSGRSTSLPVIVQPGQLVNSVAPLISGRGEVGGLLELDPGTWLSGLTGSVFEHEYQWYGVDGKIDGATGSSYVPTPADAGGKLAAVVETTLFGFVNSMAVTNIVSVDKLASAVRLSKAGKRLVRFNLSPAALRPTGKVKVYDGRRHLRTYRVRAADNGVKTVRLPKLRRGTHRITATFLGNQALERSRSKAVRIRVR